VPFHKKNYFQRRTKPKGPKANERIRSPQVQVISSDGKNLGILATQEAINIAKQEGLDLIEISANANPPVCKIIDIGKHKYDLQKKANKAKKKQKIINLKEIKLRPVTEIHDYNFKIKNAQKFLEKGDKVKFTIKFRGREMQHTYLGDELMDRIISDTAKLGKVEVNPKMEGRQIIMIVQPL
jgi:translation initiation factor IF-3